MTILYRIIALSLLWLGVLAPINHAQAAVSGPPTISGFWPGEGPPGTFVFVFGSNFMAQGTQIMANTVSAPIVQVLDDTLLIFMLPSGDTAGPITVTTSLGSASSSGRFGPNPTGTPLAVNAFWPGEGPPGSFVFVFGKHFGKLLVFSLLRSELHSVAGVYSL